MGRDDPARPRGRAAAARIFVASAVLFAGAVLVQASLAGEAALIAPEMWQAHMGWVHVFQWISPVLPVTAHLCARRIGFTLLNCGPMLIIGLQYWLIHFAINHGWATFAGLHAAAGLLLFGLLVFILQDWRYRAAG